MKKKIRARSELNLPLDVLNIHQINPEYQGPPIEVIEENENWIVISKPADIHGHPLAYSEKNNCLSFLRARGHAFWPALQVNSPAHERGLLYRLDYGTSGVLIYIKKVELFHELRQNFHSMMKEKIYYALVAGDFKKEGSWRHYFVPAGPKGGKMTVKDKAGPSPNGEWGELNAVLENYDSIRDRSLVKINLKTGLRHQIRAQLAYLGHPIIGDQLYGGGTAERLFLHAQQYSFEIMNKSYSYQSKLNF